MINMLMRSVPYHHFWGRARVALCDLSDTRDSTKVIGNSIGSSTRHNESTNPAFLMTRLPSFNNEFAQVERMGLIGLWVRVTLIALFLCTIFIRDIFDLFILTNMIIWVNYWEPSNGAIQYEPGKQCTREPS